MMIRVRGWLWGVFTAAVFLVFCSGASAQQTTPADLFELHSGFWINLHHFLYRQAQVSAPQKGQRAVSIDKADSDELAQLSPEERDAWNDAVSYYRSSVIQRDLLFDDGLITIKNQLEDVEASKSLENSQIPADLKTMLLKAAPIYRKHWWTRHDAENEKWIAQLKPLVQQYGRALSTQMAAIYEQPWPQSPVRVDAVVYANWAGAYTTLEPTRPAISSSDAANQDMAALEIVFHEASHGMMDKVSKDLRIAEQNLNAQKAGPAFHSGSIWHAVLFFTAGELVAEQVPGYVPYADKNGLWKRAWPDPDRSLIEQDWKPHMKGSIGLQPSLTKLVADLAAASSH